VAWVCWERFASIQGQQENTFDDWQAVGIFSAKERCEEHVQAMVLLTSERKTPQKAGGSQVLIKVHAEGEDVGKSLAVVYKKREYSQVTEWKCVPRIATQPSQPRKKSGNK
jgi:hypothetical protein